MVDPAEREPLHNFEAEQAVLGAILVNNAVYQQLEDFLPAEAFTDGLHRKLFDDAGPADRARAGCQPRDAARLFRERRRSAGGWRHGLRGELGRGFRAGA